MIASSFRFARFRLRRYPSPKHTLMALIVAGVLITSPVGVAQPPISRSPANNPPSPTEAGQHSPPLQDAFPETDHVRNIFASALSFIAPRTLHAHSMKELALWGLDGILTIDPALSITITASSSPSSSETFILRAHSQILLTRPLPHNDDRMVWIDLILDVIQNSWPHSAPLRAAGSNGIIAHFFSTLFHNIDPYSRYIPPQNIQQTNPNKRDKDASIGLMLARHQEVSYPTISNVNVNSDAWAQGISAGQSLIAVNGHNVRRVPLATLARWLVGPPNSPITITVRTPTGDEQSFSLNRAYLPQETVFLSAYGPYPVLRITQFSDHTADEVSQYISALTDNNDASDQEGDTPSSIQKHLPGLILDLRGNHGGVLQQAVVTAALLLNQGVITTTEGRYRAANHIWAIQGGDLTDNAPLAILVDGQTASASEVLASALADHHRAIIIGSSTYGKGLVQIAGELPNQGQLLVSWGRNIAPLGWPIQTLGLFPQVCMTRPNLTAQISALEHGHSLEQDALYQARSQRTPLSVHKASTIRAQCPATHGSESDISVAAQLLTSHTAYEAALQSVPADLPYPPAPHF
ncbi:MULTISPECIES: S41 family peptidase [unclassified Saccharibacter]|uniref:S41 family peptidase n=1 Tax=unclassified Saccharibacter TaxID=2648722 RepID=UPI00132B137C|nr:MULTISPECIES: S41 family peptidase [unclassified Saccharibacter]MXV35601.1 peptidase S41 [Saccharibacter sp. EH611]MXV58854.1 peptidase S41 [Saccharibacter sp. EH70]MXV65510.1 peptidase S41 [Saccharibacter sp. EH60]